MIKIQTLEVSGLQGAIRALREPMMSHGKSDSKLCTERDGCRGCEAYDYCNTVCGFDCYIGPNDLELAMKLAKAGPDHGKFLRMIHVSAEITAPMYWWHEADQYKIGTTTCSSSLMHSMGTIDIEQAINDAIQVPVFGIDIEAVTPAELAKAHLVEALSTLQEYIDEPTCFELMRQIMPMGYQYTKVWDANYQALRTIYHQRKKHKLSEWSGPDGFCRWVETLPYSVLIVEV